jgi:hypothetical protein
MFRCSISKLIKMSGVIMIESPRCKKIEKVQNGDMVTPDLLTVFDCDDDCPEKSAE